MDAEFPYIDGYANVTNSVVTVDGDPQYVPLLGVNAELTSSVGEDYVSGEVEAVTDGGGAYVESGVPEPVPGVTYTLRGWASDCVDPTGAYGASNCSWTYNVGHVDVTATPSGFPTPTGLAATPGNGQIVLTWDAVFGATAYGIYQGTSSGAEIFKASVSGTTYTSTGLTNGNNYYFKVLAYGEFIPSGLSNEIAIAPQGGGGVVPSITSITPSSGFVGTSVTINGSGFGASKGSSTVTFNGIVGIPTSWSDMAVVVPVPSGATSGNIVVTVNGSPSNGVPFNVEVTLSTPVQIYSYSVQASDGSSGYEANGNIKAYADSVNGNWGWNGPIAYDIFNHLIAANVALVGGGATQNWCWTYDSFGNRTQEQNANSSLPSDCSASPGATQNSMTYNSKNQIMSSSLYPASPTYDPAGNLIDDGNYQYKYDGEGRLCALYKYSNGQLTGYIYDGDGHRVAKGTLTSFSCDVNVNGFRASEGYILDQYAHQITEMIVANGQSSWVHTNVYSGAMLLATYDPKGLHFHISDWLGNRRVQTDALGHVEETCTNLPFGGFNCITPLNAPTIADDATEHHFTGKERDQESGLDYFSTRYYSSSIGRFLSPDPSGITKADSHNPQSLNMYTYAINNPLIYVDPTGLDYEWSGNCLNYIEHYYVNDNEVGQSTYSRSRPVDLFTRLSR